ncbi:MAG: Flp pilus assembly complex ATPase component TadA [Clostridia bacterium]|nr:Flp pilus assembly complex ATPase component TadA [Clostridia bacterium]
MFDGLIVGNLARLIADSVKLENLAEIRLRANKRLLLLTTANARIYPRQAGGCYTVTKEDIDGIIARATNLSPYSVSDEMIRGYIPCKNLRIGVGGEGVSDGGRLLNIKNVSYMVIRVPHQIRTAADGIIDKVYCVPKNTYSSDGESAAARGEANNTPIISPPYGDGTEIEEVEIDDRNANIIPSPNGDVDTAAEEENLSLTSLPHCGGKDAAKDTVKAAVEKEVRSTIIISPPCGGKTTLLRELARLISAHKNVVVIDERYELAAVSEGVPTLDIGESDVVSGVPKAVAYENCVRAMNPDVIVTDELFRVADVAAICDVMRSGVKVIASVHGDSVDSLRASDTYCELIKRFELAVVLKRKPVGQIKEIVEL